MTDVRPAKGKIIVFGILFWYPLAGVTYQFLHYLIGLRRLGYDPYYVEDSGRWIYDPSINDLSPDASPNIASVAPLLERFGFRDRWAFRGNYPGGSCYGMSPEALDRLYAEADAFLNVTGAQELRDEHLACPRRIYVESDPVAMQLRVAAGDRSSIHTLAAHDTLFSFGENLGAPDCGVPVGTYRWLPTRQPVAVELWDASGIGPGDAYNTITTWENKGKDVVFNGEPYFWSKHREFLKFLDVPARTGVPLELATGVDEETRQLLERHGWRLVDALEVSRQPERYQRYIQRARGEFTVAKDQNIRLRSGWFSDRSACYLAAGRPVITQDTGFGAALPTGAGLFAWRSLDDIVAAFDAVESDYPAHSRAARDIAHTYFSADTVLRSLMDRAGL